MKTYWVTILGVIILTGMLLTTGCVPKEELDLARAQNRKMDLQRKEALEEAQGLERENESLQAKIKGFEGDLTASRGMIESLTSERDLLAANKTELEKILQKLKESPITPVGDINVMLPAMIDKKLKEFTKANPNLVEYLPQYGMVKLKADLLFELGKDFVQTDAERALGKFVEIVNAPEAAKFNVYVAGHTDDIPIGLEETILRHPDNWYLSVHRAVAVEQVLVKAGLDGDRIGAMGFGKFHPIAPNKPNDGGNPVNRRVEIWIVPPDRFLTVSSPTE